jgi:hypothetical protein
MTKAEIRNELLTRTSELLRQAQKRVESVRKSKREKKLDEVHKCITEALEGVSIILSIR